MRKWILALAALALPAVAVAQGQIEAANHNVRYDADSATPTHTYCKVVPTNGDPWRGTPKSGAGKVKTTGASLTVESFTAGSSALAGVDVGDVLTFNLGSTRETRTVVTNADDDTITVDQTINLATGYASGVSYTYETTECGTGLDDGWIDVSSPFQIHVQYDQGDLTYLSVRLQCKGGTIDDGPVNVIAPADSCGGNTNDGAGACQLATPGVAGSLTWVELSGTWKACRMGLAVSGDSSDAGANRESVTVSVTRVVR
jgi:hypothetical protein